MNLNSSQIILAPVLAALLSVAAIGQTQYCTASAFKALKPVPKLWYACRGPESSYEASKGAPERKRALRRYQESLAMWYSTEWWDSPVDDLVSCDIRKKPGRLNKAQSAERHSGNYYNQLFGSKQIRVVRVDDPCFKSDYGDSNIFALYRRPSGKVVVTLLIDDFFSRADDPMDVQFANLNGTKIVEVGTTTGGLHPSYNNYYFSIDDKTGKAKPELWFHGENGPTNMVSSQMLMEEPAAYGLSEDTEPLQVISKGRFRRKFVAYELSEITNSDQYIFKKIVLKWNGKMFN